VLLHFHGVIKAVDVFMNLDFKLAFETLVDFGDIHKKIMSRKSRGNSQFFSLLNKKYELFNLVNAEHIQENQASVNLRIRKKSFN